MVNLSDSNARGAQMSDGAPANSSRGPAQCIPGTFAGYHQPGTSTSIYEPVANIAASMNYVMDRYDVSPDGSNLASRVAQANPNASTPRVLITQAIWRWWWSLVLVVGDTAGHVLAGPG